MTPTAPDEMIGERIGGRFVVDKLIGDGVLSSAWRAHDTLLERRVTVKLFHPRHADDARVVDEQLAQARAVAALSHPSIVTVIDRGEHEGMPFVVLEYVRGESLAERIDRYAPLDADEVTNYGETVARALAAAHGQNIVHGNLRPRNVLISVDRDVKIVDFGGGSAVESLTSNDPYELPPADAYPDEADAGEGYLIEPESGGVADQTEEHDLYALGAMLFEALTDQQPDPDIDAGHIRMLRPDVPPALAEVVARLLATGTSAGPSSMHGIATDLAAVPRGSKTRTDATATMAGLTAASAVATVPHGSKDSGETDTWNVDGSEGNTSVISTPSNRPKRRQSKRQRRARIVVWGAVLVPITLLGVLIVMLAGEVSSRQQETTDGPAAAAAGPLDIDEVVAFDPEGDGTENDGTLTALTDGDVKTAWESEGYDSADLGGLKDGVGVVMLPTGPAEVAEVRVITDLIGWRVQIYAADSPGKSLARWTPVSSESQITENDVRLPVDTDGEQYGAYLIWVTDLANDVDRFRARASEINLIAAK